MYKRKSVPYGNNFLNNFDLNISLGGKPKKHRKMDLFFATFDKVAKVAKAFEDPFNQEGWLAL